MSDLADASWPDLAPTAVVVVPVGSLEQHGPHLPLETDTVIAVAVAAAVVDRLEDAWLAPALTYAASGEHQGFPGTCSIGTETLHRVVVELVRSVRIWARRVVLVNAHGGNLRALTGAVDQLRAEGHDVAWVPCASEDPATGADLHAGRTETSLMLHLRPASVRLDRAVSGDTRPLAEMMATMRAGGVGAVSANGVLGDPSGATADEGASLLAGLVDDVTRRLAIRTAR